MIYLQLPVFSVHLSTHSKFIWGLLGILKLHLGCLVLVKCKDISYLSLLLPTAKSVLFTSH